MRSVQLLGMFSAWENMRIPTPNPLQLECSLSTFNSWRRRSAAEVVTLDTSFSWTSSSNCRTSLATCSTCSLLELLTSERSAAFSHTDASVVTPEETGENAKQGKEMRPCTNMHTNVGCSAFFFRFARSHAKKATVAGSRVLSALTAGWNASVWMRFFLSFTRWGSVLWACCGWNVLQLVLDSEAKKRTNGLNLLRMQKIHCFWLGFGCVTVYSPPEISWLAVPACKPLSQPPPAPFLSLCCDRYLPPEHSSAETQQAWRMNAANPTDALT